MNGFQNGTVQVANDIIDLIIAYTAQSVEGVREVKGYQAKQHRLRRNASKFICTKTEADELETSLVLALETQRPMIETIRDVQRQVQRQVESMLGLRCRRVNITVE